MNEKKYCGDFDIIADRIIENSMTNADFTKIEGKPANLDEMEAKLFENAPGQLRFKDIDYTDTNHADWKVSWAINRALGLARYSYISEGEARDRAYAMLLGILEDFVANKYVNGNWWFNDIGLPLGIREILLLHRKSLPDHIMEGMIWYLDHGSVTKHPEILTVKNAYHSGANLVWYCNVSIVHGILTDDSEEIRAAVAGIASESFGGHEGLQWDDSFFQHGRRLYSLGYGVSFIYTISGICYQVAGTSLDFAPEVKNNIARHILDGVRYMIGGKGFDYAAMGREYTRPGAIYATRLIGSLKVLASCEGFPRKEEITEFIKALESGAQPVIGVKYFPEAKFLTLHTEKAYVSFKGTDPTLFGAEICTTENYLGRNLSYGTTTTVMRHGMEYYNIGFLWDYSSVPGTTSRIEDDETLMSYPDFTWYKVEGDDFGGGQFEDIGVCFAGSEHHGVCATVTAVATEYGMIIMGAGLTEAEGKPLHTTVNQCNAKGKVTVSADGKEVSHDGIIYRNLDEKTAFRASIAHKETDHRRNNYRNVSAHFEGDLFTLDLPVDKSHGAYAYIILPTENCARGAVVLVNTKALQAVRIDDGRVVAVFHEDGELALDSGRVVSGNKGEIKVI